MNTSPLSSGVAGAGAAPAAPGATSTPSSPNAPGVASVAGADPCAASAQAGAAAPPRAASASRAPHVSCVPSAAPPRGGSWRMVLAMALSGTIGLLVVESGLPALWVVWLRCVFGGLGLAAWVLWSRQWLAPTRREWGWMAVGGVALVCNWVGLFSAYRYSSIAVATVVYHVQPFVLLVLAALFQGEALPVKKVLVSSLSCKSRKA